MKTCFTLAICFFASVIPVEHLLSQSNIQQSLSVNSTGAVADASAQLDVQATDKGILIPRMTSAQRSAIASPANGLLIFDTDSGSFWFNQGGTWLKLAISGVPTSLIADADNNTKVQTEKNPNEDIIRFDLGGTENMVLRKNAGGTPRLEFQNAQNNSFFGNLAGSSNTSGVFNTATGAGSMQSNTSGNFNAAHGMGALSNNTTGSYNTAQGAQALQSNSTGNDNTANGYQALFSNTGGQGNTAAGFKALTANTTANENTAVGTYALYSNMTGSGNTAFGAYALQSNATPGGNTAIGNSALFANTSGDNNTAVGMGALSSNLSGVQNVATGMSALFSNTTGSFNTAGGMWAMYSNTTGAYNTAFGSSALYFNSTGDYNAAFGRDALSKNTTGNDNIAIGYSTLQEDTTGSRNTAVGNYALSMNYTGQENTAFGYNVLMKSRGSYNTAFGTVSLKNSMTGFFNTAIGHNSMSIDNCGVGNTGIGSNSTVSLSCMINASALGSGAVVNADNKVVIGSNQVTVIGGYVNWSNLSDGRFKKNIREDVPGLSFINQLRPVTYTIDLDKLQHHITAQMPDSIAQLYYPDAQAIAEANQRIQTGFIAQEVEGVARQIGYNFDGVNAPKNPTDNYSIAYSQFVPSLVKAVQEQQAIIEKQQAEIYRLKEVETQLVKITAALAGAGIAIEK